MQPKHGFSAKGQFPIWAGRRILKWPHDRALSQCNWGAYGDNFTMTGFTYRGFVAPVRRPVPLVPCGSRAFLLGATP